MDHYENKKLRAALDRSREPAGHTAHRFTEEIDFACRLADTLDRDKGRWAKLIADARRLVADAAAGGEPARVEKAVGQAEELLAPIGKVAKTYTIHCVGHAHIDMNWQWSWPETVSTTIDTFTTILKLMDEFPGLRFTQSQASVYQILIDHAPDLLEAIRRRVEEGRWEIVAAQWVEGDKNLASGESLARHLLYTRRFMREQFNLSPEELPIDWEPDTFGHAVTIPSIVSRGAVSRYYLCRGGHFDKPPVFWWKGPDGRRVLVFHEITWYGGPIVPQATDPALQFCKQTGLKDWMYVYGVGDHGGGPTRRDIRRVLDMDTWPIFPNFRFGVAGDYFNLLEAHGDRWEELDCELNFEFPGCYTSQSAIKKANRYGEHLCEQAETAATLAYRTLGHEYPAAALRRAWIDTIFGHFHDILPGSGLRETREHHAGLFQNTVATTGAVKTRALRGLAAEVNTDLAATTVAPDGAAENTRETVGSGMGRGVELGTPSHVAHVDGPPCAFVVFNPTAWPREEVVPVTLWDVPDAAPLIARGPDKALIAIQQVGKGHYWSHQYVDLLVPVRVPPLGYAAHVVEQGEAPPAARELRHIGAAHETWGFRAGPLGLENEFLAVEFDAGSGGIRSLVDKQSGRQLADPDNPMALLEYVIERPRSMTAWVIGDVGRRTCPVAMQSFGPENNGPCEASMIGKLRIDDSSLTVRFVLRAGQPWLGIEVAGTWLQRGGREIGTPALRMMFPMALSEARATYEAPFGAIHRDQTAGEEVPSLRFADVTGRVPGSQARAGCTLLNDCKYGHSLDGSTLRLSLIRSSYDPDPLPEIGEHKIKMALSPHGKAPADADLIRLGAAFNHPLQVVATDVHAGRLPSASPAAACRAPGVILSAIKKAEDDDAVIFRLFETAGKDTAAQVTLDASLLGEAATAVEVDLLERDLPASTAKTTAGGFRVSLPAHGIASVKVTFTE